MRAPTEAEIARHLGLELGAYQTLLDDVQGVQIIHYEDLVRNGNGAELADHASLAARPRASWANPLGKLMAKGLREALAAAIADLPEREKLLISLLFEQDLNQKEIGMEIRKNTRLNSSH